MVRQLGSGEGEEVDRGRLSNVDESAEVVVQRMGPIREWEIERKGKLVEISCSSWRRTTLISLSGEIRHLVEIKYLR